MDIKHNFKHSIHQETMIIKIKKYKSVKFTVILIQNLTKYKNNSISLKYKQKKYKPN